jgi:formylglycine-generating enzyme required for sulfatase activity
MKKYLIKRIACVVLFCFMFLLIGDAYPLQAAAEQEGIALSEKGESASSDGFYREALDSFSRAWDLAQKSDSPERPVLTKETAKTGVPPPSVQEKEKPAPQLKKKKKFPWLLAILGVGVVIVLVVLLTKKKKQTLNLIVTVGEGVTGIPAAGSYTYKKGDSVAYAYSLSSSSYENLTVLLDGNTVAASGNVTMNSNHTLSVSGTKSSATYSNGVLTVGGVRYELASIPAGTFQMGSKSSEAYPNEQPLHTVQISKGFWLGKTEVTQGLWQAVLGSNPSEFKNGDNNPLEMVSWDDCQGFILKLNQMLGGNAFRLPTEAEWEYACRAGTAGDRYGDIDSIAWYINNSASTHHPVGQKQSNAWGLYDMLGNVWEWCQDWFGAYSAGYQTDPTGPAAGTYRVDRGGGWHNAPPDVRGTVRGAGDPGARSNGRGFRLARTN